MPIEGNQVPFCSLVSKFVARDETKSVAHLRLNQDLQPDLHLIP